MSWIELLQGAATHVLELEAFHDGDGVTAQHNAPAARQGRDAVPAPGYTLVSHPSFAKFMAHLASPLTWWPWMELKWWLAIIRLNFTGWYVDGGCMPAAPVHVLAQPVCSMCYNYTCLCLNFLKFEPI